MSTTTDQTPAADSVDAYYEARRQRAAAAAAAGILNARPRATRTLYGMPLSQAVRAVYADTLNTGLVVFGQANTFFTCPARTADGNAPTVYGFVTSEDSDTAPYDAYYVFHRTEDQRAAKANYRASIKG